jgi:hypothetical protein
MTKIIKKADIILLAALVALGILTAIPTFGKSAGGAYVKVSVDGDLYGTYSLAEDREIVIENGKHLNKITIKDGTVQMTEASCANQLCVRQGVISSTAQSIVCLPNRVVVEIVGEDGDYDVVAG